MRMHGSRRYKNPSLSIGGDITFDYAWLEFHLLTSHILHAFGDIMPFLDGWYMHIEDEKMQP